MRIIYPIILVALLFFSCVEDKVSFESVQTIQLEKSGDVLPISSFIEELDYLELKFSDSKVEIGEIQDIKVLSGDIIIKQRRAGVKSFVRFSQAGEFIAELVNSKTSLIQHPVEIMEYKKGYAILAENGIHHVSKTGRYHGPISSTNFSERTFIPVKNGFLLIQEIPEGEFLCEHVPGSVQKEKIQIHDRVKKLVYTDLTKPEKNVYHMVSSFCDTIYCYTQNELTPKYRLKAAFPTLREVWSNSDTCDVKERMRHIYDTQHVLLKNYLENESTLLLTYWIGSIPTTLIINKADWTCRYFTRAVNDIDGGIWSEPMYLTQGNELYVALSSYKIDGHKISNKRHKDFETLQQKMVGKDNPVIMRCKLK